MSYPPVPSGLAADGGDATGFDAGVAQGIALDLLGRTGGFSCAGEAEQHGIFSGDRSGGLDAQVVGAGPFEKSADGWTILVPVARQGAAIRGVDRMRCSTLSPNFANRKEPGSTVQYEGRCAVVRFGCGRGCSFGALHLALAVIADSRERPAFRVF